MSVGSSATPGQKLWVRIPEPTPNRAPDPLKAPTTQGVSRLAMVSIEVSIRGTKSHIQMLFNIPY